VLDGQQSQVALLRTEETDTSLSLPLTANDSITITKQLPEHLTAPVRAGDIVGYEYVSLNGECIREIPLIVSEDVEKVDVSYLLRLCIRIFCFS
jgi:hypothetical protein